MSIYRQNDKAGKAENTISVRRGKWIHTLAVMLFCMVLSIGTVVFADEVPATVIVAGAKIRATADTSSEALAGVKSGDTLSICGQTTGADGNVWYQVYVDADTKGFIRSDLIQKKTDGTISTVSNTNANTSTTTTTTSNTTETQATAVEKKSATVTTNGVRIRKGASTQHDVVATANRGMVLTITGEAAGSDGKTWYQVSFSYNNKEITGFIRSDLVTFDNVPADTAFSEITGTEETPEETTTEVATEPMTEEQSQPEPEPQPEPEDENANIILMNVEEEVYVLPEFTPIILKWQDQDINAFKNGKFYLFYAQKQNGETGWYLYDSEKGIYQRYVYDTTDAVIPESSALSGSTLPVIILVVVIVILLVVIGLMFLKLREYTADYYDDEYDEDDEDEEDEEDDDELEEEELEEEEPIQKPVKRPERPQPQNRPQQGGGQQPPRRQPVEQPKRPQQGGNGQPSRRPQQEGGEPIRRPQQGGGQQSPRRQPVEQPRRPQQNENGQQPRRPQQGGNGQPPRRQPGEQPKRPTQQQNRPTKGNQQLQNGRKAKNFLDAEDDDMEFIDI